jgi:MFS transporter, FHS family, Na+ dependent glucose transporter 1
LNKPKVINSLSYYAAFVAMGISMSALGPTLPGLADATKASLSAIGILFTARSLGSLAVSVLAGQLYDRKRGHVVMALMIAGIAILTALTPFAPSLWLLTGILFLTGMLQGVLNIGGNTLLVWEHGNGVGPFMNGLHFCFGMGTFLAPVIVAQFITRSSGLIWTYLLLAVIILPTALMIFLPSPVSPQVKQQKKAEKLDIGLVVLISLVFACYGGISSAFGGWIFTYATEMKLANATNAAYLTSVFWGALTLGRLVAIPLAIRFKPQSILRADYVGAALSLVVMLIWPKSIVAVMITAAGLGFALASIYPTTMSMAGQMMTISGRVTGLFSVGSSTGGMLLPWIVGQFFDLSGPTSMTLILVVDMLIGLAVLAVLAVQTRKPVVKTV